MRLVLDASVALSWLFADERTSLSVAVLNAVRRGGAMVPPLWPTEIVQALLKAERRRRIPSTGVTQALNLFRDLPIAVDRASATPAFSELTYARRFNLSAYDACYLDLAVRHATPLATLDSQLASAAKALGIDWKPKGSVS